MLAASSLDWILEYNRICGDRARLPWGVSGGWYRVFVGVVFHYSWYTSVNMGGSACWWVLDSDVLRVGTILNTSIYI